VPLSIYPGAPGSRGRDVKVTTRSRQLISFGDEDIDLSAVEQLVEKSQTRAIADALLLMRSRQAQVEARGSALVCG
jgi:hypothetical protein